MTKTLKAFVPGLNKKLKDFGIHPKFFAEMRALVEHGTRPSSELRTRLAHVTNYKACFDSLLAELSQPAIQRLPPDHFESIEVLP